MVPPRVGQCITHMAMRYSLGDNHLLNLKANIYISSLPRSHQVLHYTLKLLRCFPGYLLDNLHFLREERNDGDGVPITFVFIISSYLHYNSVVKDECY